MEAFDVLVVGGGPAGSSCAWALRNSGLRVAIADKARFPRDKVCGGWITPQVLTALAIGADEYASTGRMLQPITAFRTAMLGGRQVETAYNSVVSYGIRRCEFDHYLLQRSGAYVLHAPTMDGLRRSSGEWMLNGQLRARMLVGAGGHFCPVARLLGARSNGEPAVLAQELEFEMDPSQAARCTIRGEVPELFFCRDMKGYGWCFRKGNFLNIGLGRLDPRELSAHVTDFLRHLRDSRIRFDIAPRPRGHAYLLYATSARRVTADGVLLIGDAAGLAYSQSGEGIRPAIESGLLAAKCIAQAAGDYTCANLERYRTMLTHRFGERGITGIARVGRRLPAPLLRAVAAGLVRSRSFTRSVLLRDWFLHASEPALHL